VKAAPGFEPGDGGFADLCLTAWLCCRRNLSLANFGTFTNRIQQVFEID
jgi:hypothetical protein